MYRREFIGQQRELIIFGERHDTLNYLAGELRTFASAPRTPWSVPSTQDHRDKQREVRELFSPGSAHAGARRDRCHGCEGINLQGAHLMVNYDLPWNPDRIERRFGHRPPHWADRRLPPVIWSPGTLGKEQSSSACSRS